MILLLFLLLLLLLLITVIAVILILVWDGEFNQRIFYLVRTSERKGVIP